MQPTYVYCPHEFRHKGRFNFDYVLTEAEKPCWSCGKMAPAPYKSWWKSRGIIFTIAVAVGGIILVYVL